jgi:hypothetical protein
VNQYLKKYFICVLFTIDLTLLVVFSEILRYVTTSASLGVTSGNAYFIAFGVFVLFAFMFIIIPLSLLIMWIFNPLALKKLLIQFGLNEKTLDRKKPKEKSEEPVLEPEANK